MELSLGFSPCPNDTFIFDAMIHKKIDVEGLDFKVFMEDVETLNRKALQQELEITKLSCFAYGRLAECYVLLDSGGAMGMNCGPLLIAKKSITQEAINEGPIAIPGDLTTANFLFSLAYPKAAHKIAFTFNEIEDAVLDGVVNAGVIIHENRFTYESRGLTKIVDLGSYWEEKTGFPIPLGAIAVKRTIPDDLKHKINRVIRRSVEFALANPDSSLDFVKTYAQEMDVEVMQKHIALYVNHFSVDMGDQGREALNYLYGKAKEMELIKQFKSKIFLN